MRDTTDIVTDHEYWGNMCSGFGGTLECKALDQLTGQTCGKSPGEHNYYEGKHTRSRLYTNITQTPNGYDGKHAYCLRFVARTTLAPCMAVKDGVSNG